MRRAVAALTPTLALVQVLLLVELAVRLTLPAIAPLHALVTNPVQQGDFVDERNVGIFEGDPTLFWRLQPNLNRVAWDFTLVSTNEAGLRQQAPLRPKADDGFRIVTVGDSVTFGYRVPVVFPNQPLPVDGAELPYPGLLEQALRAANPGAVIDVVNLAVPGYSSHQGLAWVRRDLPGLDADVVTWCFGWNDSSMRPVSDADAMPNGALVVGARKVVLRSQALLHVARRLRAGDGTATGTLVPRVSPADYVANAEAFVHLTRGLGAQPLILAPVYRDARTFPEEAVRMRERRDALRALARRLEVPWVEVPELVETAAPHNEGLFGELIHPNAAGHRLMALAVLRALEGLRLPVVVPDVQRGDAGEGAAQAAGVEADGSLR